MKHVPKLGKPPQGETNTNGTVVVNLTSYYKETHEQQ